MTDAPSTTDPNGHDGRGRFTANNKCAVGNPHAKRVAKIRALLMRSVKDKDLKAIIGQIVDQAKAGDLACARELFDRLIGKPSQTELIARVEILEDLLRRRGMEV